MNDMMNNMRNEKNEGYARKMWATVPVLVAVTGWGLMGPAFQARPVVSKQNHTEGMVVDENRRVDELRRQWFSSRFPDKRKEIPPPVTGGPLDGMEIEPLMATNLHLLLALPERKTFCHVMVARFLKEDSPRENHPPVSKMTVSGNDRKTGRRAWRESYGQTDFRPRRKHSIPRQFAGLAPDHKKRQELLVLGEVLLYEIESNRDFRRNNLTYAVALAVGTAIEIERGQALDETDILTLLQSVHQLLTEKEGFMDHSTENLTMLYDTCLLVSGLMTAFHGDACAHGRMESATAARRLARSLLQVIGWSDEESTVTR